MFAFKTQNCYFCRTSYYQKVFKKLHNCFRTNGECILPSSSGGDRDGSQIMSAIFEGGADCQKLADPPSPLYHFAGYPLKFFYLSDK